MSAYEDNHEWGNKPVLVFCPVQPALGANHGLREPRVLCRRSRRGSNVQLSPTACPCSGSLHGAARSPLVPHSYIGGECTAQSLGGDEIIRKMPEGNAE
jgi:hypothetical protein